RRPVREPAQRASACRPSVQGTQTVTPTGGQLMSVYKVIDIIGTSTTSWEDAATTAVTKARETLRDLRVGQVVEQDLDIGEDGAVTFRTKLAVSFKYEDG